MLLSPLTVINETLDNLHTVRELLRDEVDERMVRANDLTLERRLCRDALRFIEALIPTLEAVRGTPIAVATSSPRACVACED